MNAKKAKALRKMLRKVAQAQAADGKEVMEVGYLENERNRKYVVVPKTSFNPLESFGSDEAKTTLTTSSGTVEVEKPTPKTERVQVAPGTISVAPNTVRGLYKKIKKAMGGKPQVRTPQPTPTPL